MSENTINLNIATPTGREQVEVPQGATMEKVAERVAEKLGRQIGDLKFLLNSEKVKDFLQSVEESDNIIAVFKKMDNGSC